jgi:hypothetical protein
MVGPIERYPSPTSSEGSGEGRVDAIRCDEMWAGVVRVAPREGSAIVAARSAVMIAEVEAVRDVIAAQCAAFDTTPFVS